MKLKSFKIIALISFFLFTFLDIKLISHIYGEGIMSGMKLSDFPNFEKKWRFVTVRYRKDSGEMRFVYANEKAWNYLQTSGADYPKGSMFGKISIMTKEDSVFPSSVMPSEQRRVQFMFRNKKKFSTTGGWGYALFKPDGELYKGNMKKKVRACFACHLIVKKRGQVFSRPLSVPVGDLSLSEGINWKAKFKFKNVNLKNYAPLVYKKLPKDIGVVRILKGPLTRDYFFGTFDEIRPLLISEFKKSKKPTALIAKDRKSFSIVYQNKNNSCSKKKEYGLSSMHSVQNDRNPVLKFDFCEDK